MDIYAEPTKYDVDLVAYASGMVSMQASCDVTDAVALMTDHARYACVTVVEIAESVVALDLEFC